VKRWLWVAVGVVALALVAFGAYRLLAEEPARSGGADLEMPEQTTSPATTEEEPSLDTTGAAAVPADVTVGDPVPDDVVAVLFDLVSSAGYTPKMNETYVVEFGETTQDVLVSGTFEEGEHSFEFEYDEGEWRLEDTDDQ